MRDDRDSLIYHSSYELAVALHRLRSTTAFRRMLGDPDQTDLMHQMIQRPDAEPMPGTGNVLSSII